MLLVLTLTFSIGAMAQETEPTQAPAQTEAIQYQPEDVVAKAFGEEILYKDILPYYNQLLYTYASQGLDLSLYPEMQPSLEMMAANVAVNYIAVEKIAEEKGIYPLAAEKQEELKARAQSDFDQAVDQYTSQLLAEKENPTDEEKAEATKNAQAYFTGENTTVEAFLEELTQDYITNEMFNVTFEELTKDVQVTDEEVKAKFDQQVEADKVNYEASVYNYEMAQMMGQSSYYRPAGYRGISHILLTVDDELLKNYQELLAQMEEQNNAEEVAAQGENGDAAQDPPQDESEKEVITQEQIDEAKEAILSSVQATVDEIMGKLATGESFAALVEEYGTDPGMQSEPYKSQGYPVHIESMSFDPPFTAGAFSDKMQKIGDVSDPVIGSYGVHILNYLADLPEGAIEFTDAIKTAMESAALTTKTNDVFGQAVQAKVAQGDVEILIQDPLAQAAGEEEPQQEEAPADEAPAEEPVAPEEEKKED